MTLLVVVLSTLIRGVGQLFFITLVLNLKFLERLEFPHHITLSSIILCQGSSHTSIPINIKLVLADFDRYIHLRGGSESFEYENFCKL